MQFPIRKSKSLVALCGAIIVAILLNGCAALVVGGAAGVGTYAYIRGELKVTESASLDRCWSATESAMKELQFPVTTRQKDALQGRIIARTALDKKVEINLVKVTEGLTEIQVRIGTFGDEPLSRTIIGKIEKQL